VILRAVILGIPRKLIARNLYLSLKAIERRLTQLKRQLKVRHDRSLQTVLHETGLLNFLLACPDWFGPTPKEKAKT
jgi:DNA-binding NarL/FixJ family response regulator